MAYDKHPWQIGEAITQDKMNHIEDGIVYAHILLDNNVYNKDTINSMIEDISRTASQASTDASEALVTASEAAIAANDGVRAWSQIQGALARKDDQGETIDPYVNLATRLNADKTAIEARLTALDDPGSGAIKVVSDNIQLATEEIKQARGQTHYKTVPTTAAFLRDKIEDMDYQINLNRDASASAVRDLNNAKGSSYNSVQDRLDAIDGGTLHSVTMSQEIEDLQTEISEARGINSSNVGNTALKQRFEQDEALINARVQYTDVKDDLVSNDTNKPLSAKQGKVLDGKISSLNDTVNAQLGGNYTNQATVTQAINTAEQNAKDYSDTHKVDKNDIYNGIDHTADDEKVLDARVGKTLADRIDAIDNASTGTVHGLDTRLTAAESAISHVKDVNNANDKGGLTERIIAAETNINTIAEDLAMYNTQTGAIEATNSRVDTIEENVVAMAKEIGMLQDDSAVVDLSTAVSRTNTRVDDIDTEITNAHRQDVNNDTLDNRFDDLEHSISHPVDANNNDAGGLTQRVGALETNLGTANSAINGLDTRLDAIDGGSAIVNAHTLAERVTTLEEEPKSATTIITSDCITYNAETGIPTVYTTSEKTTPITPTQDVDYLLQNGEKYYYWKYITGTGWQLISGGGGGAGSSSGEFAASLSLTDIPSPDVNTDYFVGNHEIGFTHYRYVIEDGEESGEFVRILPKGLVRNVSVNNNGGLVGYTVEDSSTNIFNGFSALKTVSYDVEQISGVDTTVITFVDTNGTSHRVEVVGGGGGTAQTVRLNNTLSSLNLIVPDKEGVTTLLKAKAIVKDGSEIDTSFSAALNVATQYSLDQNGPWTNYTTQQVQNNVEFSVDISSILRTGVKTYVRLVLTTVIEENTVTRTVLYEVSKVEMSIAAVNFNPAIVRNGDFNFAYRCMGAGLTKVVHFEIDGTDVVSPVTTTLHNDRAQQSIPLQNLAVGMHTFRVYFTVGEVESNVLNYYILYNNDNSRVAPIVALAAEQEEITFGDDLKINYTVATIGAETTDEVVLELYTVENNVETILTTQTFVNVPNETLQTWRPVDYPTEGTVYIRATATHTVNDTDYTDTKTVSVIINELTTDYQLVPAGTENLVYAYNAYGRTNNDAGKETFNYTYVSHDTGNPEITWTGSFNNFNWSGDGYVDGQSLTISGGATHTVNVPIFSTAYNNISLEADPRAYSDITQNGRTVEIEYEVQSATNLNDVIINYMADGAGIKVTPQSAYLLKSGSTANIDSTGFILNESDIAAAYLTPGMRIHLAFVIEPWSDTLAYDGSYHQSVNIYVNGEFANACPYVRGTDSFSSTATLSIGSSSCIIKLYQIKLYNRGLSHKEILQNYKMAPATTREKLNRFFDNDILDENDKVDYEKARTKYTCLLLTGPEPIYTTTTSGETVLSNPTISPYKGYPSPAGRTDKKTGEAVGKTESGVTLTKANPNNPEGYDIEFDLRDKVPTDQNIEVPSYIGARGAYVSSNNVQGTSSQKYPVHNLKVYLAKWQGPKTTTTEVALEEGEDTTGLEIVEHDGVQYKVVTETAPAEIKKVKYSLKGKDEHGEDIGVAESTLCWKADYMSTDHANTYNANIADGLFSDVLPGASWGSKHQNIVYGIRCLLFQKQGNNAPEFLGDGCLNNDKGNNKTYDLERSGDSNADTSSQKWEFTNNSDDLGYFKTDTVFRTIGEGANAHIQAKDAFESTYPDEGDLSDAGYEPNYNHLQILLTWLSKRANYWDETNPTTRAAKKQIFIDEFQDHINLNHALTYYLFSEYVALCDNRVKNMFFRSDNIKDETVYKISDGLPIFEGNSNPNADFFKQIDAIDTGSTQQVAVEDPETHEISYETQTVYRYELHNRDDIDWENSTFAVWAPVLYDLDSCFGVENVGYIRVRYDANWDYTWNNAPQFNGYDSRLWLQFADCFDSEIKAAALTLYNRADGLNYTNFYRQQITGNLNNISPALSNQDMLVKFDKPWSEGFMNYSLAEPAMETPYYKYLQRGSRTAQKTAFMSMRSKLLSSKYGAAEFTNDSIKFRTGVPVGQSNLQDTKITVVANQVMYPGVAYGDNKEPTRATANGGKVNAGQACDIVAGSPVQGNDGIFICGASILTDIGDLSAFRPYQIDVGAGVNLKRLIVGSNASGYTNGNTDSFQNLNKCVLLEEVNIQNCTNVSTLDLSNNSLIKKVYAAGSGTTTLIFPNGGVLNTVEYSANTGNITLLNQGNLVNFTYDGAEDTGNVEGNHYALLTKLWIENTPNVPIVSIITKAISHLTAGIRLVGIDLDLGADATFLETIVSDLAKGKYLDSSGGFTPGTTNYPYISGRVHITSIRASLLNEVHRIYPDLMVYDQIGQNGEPIITPLTEYTIKYLNYDRDEDHPLYVDYRLRGENYIDPVSDENPITHQAYITMPTKPEDAQYIYRFGTYTTNGQGIDVYKRYSGWVKRGTTTNPKADDEVQDDTVFIAVYPEESAVTKRYTVSWYDGISAEPCLSYTEDYGAPVGTYQAPEEKGLIRRVQTVGTQIKVFKGWDRPVGILTSNIDVHALWETSTLSSNAESINMSTLTAADLYALSRFDAEAKTTLLESKLGSEPIMIKMGRDFEYTQSVTTTDLLNGADRLVFTSDTTEAKIFDGNHGVGEVRPLAINSNWTLAIDFKFLLDPDLYSKSAEYVLVSCYKEANSAIQGFKVSLVKNNDSTKKEQAIRVSWGNATPQIIDYVSYDQSVINSNDSNSYKLATRTYRNVLVLRHLASQPNNLYVYYAAPDISYNQSTNAYGYGAEYNTTTNSATLQWANSATLDTPLIFGGNYAGETTNIESTRATRCPAKGIIYWSKFWDTDIGVKNCNALVAWTHETVPFYLCGYNNNSTNPGRQLFDNTNLTFVAAQGMGDRYLFARTNDLTTGSMATWEFSRARQLCNNRIYAGLPVTYQSIITQTAIESVYVNMNDLTDRRLNTTNDYFYLPTELELTPELQQSNMEQAKRTEIWNRWTPPWPWLRASNITNLYGPDGNNDGAVTLKSASDITIFLYRFSGRYISPSARIFDLTLDPYNNGGAWSYNNTQIRVQSGDVWIKNGVPYMYFTNAEIAEGIYVDEVTAGGGWKKADMWNLRTYSTAAQYGAENQFERVEDNGTIDTLISSSSGRNVGRLLCPEFSI